MTESQDPLAQLEALPEQLNRAARRAHDEGHPDARDAQFALAGEVQKLLPAVREAFQTLRGRLDRETEIRRQAEDDVVVMLKECERIPYADEYDNMEQKVKELEAEVARLKFTQHQVECKVDLLRDQLAQFAKAVGSPGLPTETIEEAVKRVEALRAENAHLRQQLEARLARAEQEHTELQNRYVDVRASADDYAKQWGNALQRAEKAEAEVSAIRQQPSNSPWQYASRPGYVKQDWQNLQAAIEELARSVPVAALEALPRYADHNDVMVESSLGIWISGQELDALLARAQVPKP